MTERLESRTIMCIAAREILEVTYGGEVSVHTSGVGTDPFSEQDRLLLIGNVEALVRAMREDAKFHGDQEALDIIANQDK